MLPIKEHVSPGSWVLFSIPPLGWRFKSKKRNKERPHHITNYNSLASFSLPPPSSHQFCLQPILERIFKSPPRIDEAASILHLVSSLIHMNRKTCSPRLLATGSWYLKRNFWNISHKFWLLQRKALVVTTIAAEIIFNAHLAIQPWNYNRNHWMLQPMSGPVKQQDKT